ncbi:GIY-YIG nuclease family protein [Patescibacteria group bacterium]|nr:GIY-YIG nuclease family protein [Patescibacteria group bacterium]
MYYVYILKSIVAKKSYVGYTDNVERRLKEHNLGRHDYTKRHLPWELFYREEYPTKIGAIQRERYFKSAAGRRFLKKLFKQ